VNDIFCSEEQLWSGKQFDSCKQTVKPLTDVMQSLVR